MKEVMESLRNAMAFCANDWAADSHMAWLYGVIVGWDDVADLADKFGWDANAVARLRRMRAEVEALT